LEVQRIEHLDFGYLSMLGYLLAGSGGTAQTDSVLVPLTLNGQVAKD
jgi:hypothetical protein